MPQQETFFEHYRRHKQEYRFLKSYDAAYARVHSPNGWRVLLISSSESLLTGTGADSTDSPVPGRLAVKGLSCRKQYRMQPARTEFLSYFIVTENRAPKTVPRFVSPGLGQARSVRKNRAKEK